ncbi:HTH-type transcriptional regulator GltR [Pigmentiphaga humi]|uniref:HTH-type transcriptional regulator GltR n=1 Tax=Pigmentiphaga humi TaxID=2478468 RepID=A0A3P4B463_9BURK|nr:LysR family transcriptional regulator [Pigmentiphaga humi]VCU71084.1 HTH-type transcriptional regulator GltR [Pigmentiphaga humi]
MNLRFLETFIWLARLRNFRMTAEKLHTTQAAVSNRISTLERDFGVRLFERGTRGVTLTQEGTRALAHAERILKLAQRMQNDVADRSTLSGIIRIGVVESVVHTWLPDFLRRLGELYPRVIIELTSDTALPLCEQLLNGSLDLSLQTVPVAGDEIVNSELGRYAMQWVASPALALPPGPLDLPSLAAFPIISFPRNSVGHRAMEELFAEVSVDIVRINCIASVAAMIRLAQSGFGVAALPPAVILRELEEGTLRLLPVEQAFPEFSLIASCRSGPEHLLLDAIVRLVREVFRDYAAGAPAGFVLPPAAGWS